ncbi:MAG: hypothetical protein OQJ84_01175 [Xanthomonadales bacterium]|nr:hypothetical protein [Xanthomonadales bacterium]
MKPKTSWSLAALLYVNLLPYLCRLPRGLDWAMQYLPDPGYEILGIIFLHGFFSLPAIPLLVGIRKSTLSRAPWLLPLLVISILTCYINYDYDLASDAQAAIGLVFFPVFIMLLAWAALAVGNLVQWLQSRTRLESPEG